MNVQYWYRPPFGPRIHFDENAAGGGGGAGGSAGGGAGSDAGAGGAAKPWFEGIDAETIGHWDNKGFKKEDPKALVTDLTKAWKGLEKHFGAPADRIIRLPEKADDEAGWSAVRQRLGMPKEAKEYDFANVKFADGTELDTGFADTMRAALHKAGVSKDGATDIARTVVKFMDDADAAEANTRAGTIKAERDILTKEWGTNFEFNRLTAMQGAKRLGVDEATVDVLQGSIGYAKVMEMFRRIGQGTSEDTFIEPTHGNPTTLNGARAKIAELKGDPEWTARYLAGGKKERDELDNLMKLVHGEAA